MPLPDFLSFPRHSLSPVPPLRRLRELGRLARLRSRTKPSASSRSNQKRGCRLTTRTVDVIGHVTRIVWISTASEGVATFSGDQLTSDNETEQSEDRTEHLDDKDLDKQLCINSVCQLQARLNRSDSVGLTYEGRPRRQVQRSILRYRPRLRTTSCTRPSSTHPRTMRSQCSSWRRCKASLAKLTIPAWRRTRWLVARGGEGARSAWVSACGKVNGNEDESSSHPMTPYTPTTSQKMTLRRWMVAGRLARSNVGRREARGGGGGLKRTKSSSLR